MLFSIDGSKSHSSFRKRSDYQSPDLLVGLSPIDSLEADVSRVGNGLRTPGAKTSASYDWHSEADRRKTTHANRAASDPVRPNTRGYAAAFAATAIYNPSFHPGPRLNHGLSSVGCPECLIVDIPRDASINDRMRAASMSTAKGFDITAMPGAR